MILLLGASGYIGSAFKAHLEKHRLPFKAPLRSEVDYGQHVILRDLLLSLKPDFVLSCVGYTGIPNVDAAEKNKPKCLESNLLFPVRLADLCVDQQIPLGHLSTGCIYSGTLPDGSGFKETDPPNFSFKHNNCSFYSGCKAMAEDMLANQSDLYLWRLRRPFNEIAHPRNYLVKTAGYRKLIDTENSITQLDEFIEACLLCMKEHFPSGIYNIVNPGTVRTSELAEMMLRHGLISEAPAYFKDESQFRELAGPTPRSECILDPTKIIKHGARLSEVHEALEEAMGNWTEVSAVSRKS